MGALLGHDTIDADRPGLTSMSAREAIQRESHLTASVYLKRIIMCRSDIESNEQESHWQ